MQCRGGDQCGELVRDHGCDGTGAGADKAMFARIAWQPFHQREQPVQPCAGQCRRSGWCVARAVPPARYDDGHSQVFEQSTTCGPCPLVSGSHAQRGDRKQRRTRENTTSTNGRCRRRSRGADSCIARAGRGNVGGRQQPQPGRKHVFPAECHLRRLPYPGLGGRPDPGSGQRRRLPNADRGVERLHLERRSWRPRQRLRILAQRCLRVRPQRHLGRRPEPPAPASSSTGTASPRTTSPPRPASRRMAS